MEKDCGERENGNGFQLLGRGRIGGSKQGILKEHDFRPYSPYGEKELMMMMMMSKTNFMIIKSIRKKDMSVNIQIRKSDGTSHPLVHKNHINCLEVMIDDFCLVEVSYFVHLLSDLEKNRHYIKARTLPIYKGT